LKWLFRGFTFWDSLKRNKMKEIALAVYFVLVLAAYDTPLGAS